MKGTQYPFPSRDRDRISSQIQSLNASNNNFDYISLLILRDAIRNTDRSCMANVIIIDLIGVGVPDTDANTFENENLRNAKTIEAYDLDCSLIWKREDRSKVQPKDLINQKSSCIFAAFSSTENIYASKLFSQN